MDTETTHRNPITNLLNKIENNALRKVVVTASKVDKLEDLKVLTNEMLTLFPEFEHLFIGVDVLNPERKAYNAKGIRSVSKHLSGGGALLVFPSGTVSEMTLPFFKIEDAPWTQMITRLARKYKAPITPIFVESYNRTSFYLSGLVNKRLRTLLLPRAMYNKSNSEIPLHFGAPIPPQDLNRLNGAGDDILPTHFIRMCCEVLGAPKQITQESNKLLTADPIKNDIAPNDVTAHLSSLEDCMLYEQDNFALYSAPYDRLGPVMEQLSIERERTFRGVDEGTGKEIDSDHFDPHYMHLFLWDKEASKIAGGYRLGKTDEIYKAHGLDGLYSHSLFDYNADFLDKMGKTIEVGRSFVTHDYQKNPRALDMLWKGIGRFVAQNNEYHTLFGCVSISRQYSALAKAILTDTFLSHYGVEDSVKRNVKARTPISAIKTPWTGKQLARLCEIPVLNKLIGRIDSGKSIPVLIRHYLALNGRFISFTVNTGFNAALDGLIMVDLRTTNYKYLKRYMNEDGAKIFLERHEKDKSAA